jgi:acetyl-CoA synthetase
MELESAVAEAAVVARDHPEKGAVPDVYATLRNGVEPGEEVRTAIDDAVEAEIGAFARPANVFFVDDLPKTRSGKIMRRLLEDISNDDDLGDTTTLRDPSVPQRIREQVGAE